ncbi:MAG: metal ABC transporter permease [Alphaproteobacteria bacterium]|nr:metal ABC transporter permease [Alphaproteobacteria bacterium]
MDDFLVRAILGGVGTAIVAGPLGAFIVWRRLAYSGEALAHSSLLGVAVGVIAGIDTQLAVPAVCVALALVMVGLQARNLVASDTLLGIISSGSLGLGMVVLSFVDHGQSGAHVDVMALLFGDILLVRGGDLALIYGGGAVVLAALAFMWRWLLAITVHEDLARVEGVPAHWVAMAFMLIVALVIATAIKIVGVLLIVAIMIMPAATARRLTATPETMAVGAAVVGAGAVVSGLAGSWFFDTPAGPSIVVAAAIFFAAVSLFPRRRSY